MRSRWFNVFVLIGLFVGLFSPPVAATGSLPAASRQDLPGIEIEPGLRVQLMGGQTAGYLIYFHEKPDLSLAYTMDWIERGRFVADALRQAAERSQAGVRAYLDKQGIKYEAFWVENVILVESSPYAIFNGLMTFPEISALRQRRVLGVIEPQRVKVPAAPQAIEPNITHVQADQVWAMGYDGEGIVVANVDTGVRYTHEALVAHYRGNEGGGTFDHNYNWWDPYGNHPASPADDNGHGTHTMGTTVGDDGGANRIGMAPGAKWMACRACNTNECSDAALLECAQFYAAPWDLNKANANPDLRPNIVNNSWGDCSKVYDPWYQDVVDAWHAAGIYPVFSNGNAGNCGYAYPPGLNTVGNPGRYGNVTGVGSTGRDDGQYATHSNWGPTDDPDTVNPTAGWENLKPQVVAPGDNIRSSVNGGDAAYQGGWSGTSMSAPHVTGLIALMWEAAPCLVGDYAATETMIEETAMPIPYDDGTGSGTHVPNYATGWGEINALAAVQAAAGHCGDSAIAGRVTDAATTNPLPDAMIIATGATGTRKAASDAVGNYAMTVFSDTYTLRAAHYGYRTATLLNVVATTGATTTQNIAMTPAAIYEISGRVTDAVTGWPLYAHISISGDPVNPPSPYNSVWTNPATGEYGVMLAEGVTYTLKAEAWVPGYGVVTTLAAPLTTDVTVNFALQVDNFACTAPGYELQETVIFSDSFEAATEGVFPAGGWDQVDVSGLNGNWIAPTHGLGPEADPYSGTRLASFNSYSAYNGESARLWRADAGVDLTGVPFPRVSLWFFHGNCGWNNGDSLQVQASTDDGVTWSDVGAQISQKVSGGWELYQFDLGAYKGNSDVRLGLLGVSHWGCNIHVDDVRVSNAVCGTPAPGGLLVGNVYDGNYPAVSLTGAKVTNATGDRVVATETPEDSAVGDAFYTLFALAGTQTFTATMKGGYGPGVTTLTMSNGATVAHDFSLHAGLLSTAPDGIAATLELGYTRTTTLNLANAGKLPAAYEFIEQEAGYVPAITSNGHGEWLYRATEGIAVKDAQDGISVTYPSAYRWTPNTPSAVNVLVYADDFVHRSPDTLVDQALRALGVGYTVHYDGDFSGFVTDLADGGPWDLVIFQNANYRSSSDVFPALLAYVEADGKLAAETWTMFEGPTDPLYEAMGVVYVGNDLSVPPVRWWEPEHILFNFPELAPEWLTRGCRALMSCGQYLDPVGGVSEALAGYTTPGPYAGEGALILRYDGQTLFKGFSDTTTDVDADGDSVLDGVELWENIIIGLLNGFETDIPWLSEVPISGTVAASGNLPVVVGFDAAYVDQPGQYYARLIVKNDTPYGKLTLPVTMTVTPPDSWGKLTGVVTGLGVCDADPAPLSQATVKVESATTGHVWMLETDKNGAYTLWFTQTQSPVTVTVTGAEGDYFGERGGVVVTQQQTTTLNFDLRLLKPCLTAGPKSLAMTLEVGASDVASLTLGNAGIGTMVYELFEINRGLTPVVVQAQVHQSRRALPISRASLSVGAAPLNNPPATVLRSEQPLALLAPNGTVAYATEPNIGQFLSLDVARPDVLNVISAFEPMIWAGDFGVDGVLYAIDSDTNQLISIDPESGATTGIGSITSNDGQDWTGMALDPSTGIMYASSTQCGGGSTLYTINLGTGVAASVGEISNVPCAIALAVDSAGQMYTYDISTDTLSRVDRATGAGTLIGPIGFDAAFGQGMDFDSISGQMLMAAFNNETFQGELRAVNLATGATTLLGVLGGSGSLYQLGWLALPNSGDIPWLSTDPVSGTLDTNAVSVLDVVFDAGVSETTQPGDYHGALIVSSNAANGSIQIPVTLTVTPPDSWGKVTGTVVGLEVCDTNPTPLSGVEVFIRSSGGLTWTATTDANGAYRLWLDEAHSPLTVSVSVPGYLPGEITGVSVTSGGVNTVDLSLRRPVPCVQVTPPALHLTQTLGTVTSKVITLTNTGAVAANWVLVEGNAGAVGNPVVKTKILLSEGFEGTIPPLLPPAWETTVITWPSGYQPVWASNVGTHFPSGMQVHSGANLVYFNSHSSYSLLGLNSARLWYAQPLSGLNVLTYWLYHDTNYPGANNRVQAQLSTDGGLTWVNVGPEISLYDGTTGWRHEIVDLGNYIIQPEVWVGFLGMSDHGSDIHLDDIEAMFVDRALWMTESPIDGVLEADSGVQTVTVSFDTTLLNYPNEYLAYLDVVGDHGELLSVLPVTLTAMPSDSHGLVTGEISSLGRCNVTTATLKGAEVGIWDITGNSIVTLTTETDGAYRYWLPAGVYTVTVVAPDHVGNAARATVTVGGIVEQNFNLTWLGPCVASVEPPSLEVTVTLGGAKFVPLTLVNDAETWNFTFSEMPAVSWLSVDPASGLIAPAASRGVAITFDAGTTEPGVYSTTLVITGNDEPFTIPVTMRVVISEKPANLYLPLVMRSGK
ncbi:MAG: S8 family serine peptidase [Anaerolineae bacterium]|nr:S8 family serine peptidase [Anaerolineae bacterium]